MSECIDNICGLGDVTTPSPLEPSGGYSIKAESAFGGIMVSWSYPTVNPEAVKHMRLYRKIGTAAMPEESDLHARVGGTHFYDSIPSEKEPKTYYYWIKVVSFSEKISGFIGPAHATAYDSIANIITQISLDIENSAIGEKLSSHIQSIVPNEMSYTTYKQIQEQNYQHITEYIDNNTQVKSDSAALLIEANTKLQTANESILAKQDIMMAYHNDAIAAIGYTSKMKVGYSAYEKLKIKIIKETGLIDTDATAEKEHIPFDGDGITSVYADIVANFDIQPPKDSNWGNSSYLLLKPAGITIDGVNHTINTVKDTWATPALYAKFIKSVATWPAGEQDAYYRIQAYSQSLNLIIDAVGVAEWNRIRTDEKSPHRANMSMDDKLRKLFWIPGLPMAEIGRKSQVTYRNAKGDNVSMKVEEALSTQVDLNDRLLGQYFVKMHGTGPKGEGLISGFGLATTYSELNGTTTDEGNRYSSESDSTFLVNANTFAVGAPSDGNGSFVGGNANDVDKPFIVRSTPGKDKNGTIELKSDGTIRYPVGVYINQAYITNLTFSAVTSDDHAFTFTPGVDGKRGKTFAHDLTVDRLHVGNKNGGTFMDVTARVIRIFQGGQIRVKIGDLGTSSDPNVVIEDPL